MKTSSLPFRLLAALVTLLIALLAIPAAHAQSQRTNDIIMPWGTIAAAGNTNVVGWGNANGIAPAASIHLQPGALGATFTLSFQCATVTLAAASCVIQASTDNATWHSVPVSSGGAGAFVISVPASAASANNTNVVYCTNLTQAMLGGFSYFRAASFTNGNAANITSPRLTAAWW